MELKSDDQMMDGEIPPISNNNNDNNNNINSNSNNNNDDNNNRKKSEQVFNLVYSNYMSRLGNHPQHRRGRSGRMIFGPGTRLLGSRYHPYFRPPPVGVYVCRVLTDTTKKIIPGTTSCGKCGVLFCQKNADFCNTCLNIPEDIVEGIPKSLVIMHCNGCDCYSFTGRAQFVPAPLLSREMKWFLVRRIELHLFRLHLNLIDASFIPTDRNDIIKLALLLEEDQVEGPKLKKRHVMDYFVAHESCYTCSPEGPFAQPTPNNIVQLRQCVSDRRSIASLLLRMGRDAFALPLKICKPANKGMDICFTTSDDAMAYVNFLCTRFVIKPDKVQTSPGNGTYISAMMCPISNDDLIYLRCSKVLGHLTSFGPFVICTKVTNSISLLDPSTLSQRTVSADEYWSEPETFKVYKNFCDLVEYVVLDVNTISWEIEHTLLDVEVARMADFGKNYISFTTRTHLGDLKPGDHAFGYDLYGGNNSGMITSDEDQVSWPDVVLVRKKSGRMRPFIRRKNTSPEYAEFLKELENNPEAMFNLSLNGGENKADKLNTSPGMTSSAAGQNSDFDLEGLLADLALGDQQEVNAPGS